MSLSPSLFTLELDPMLPPFEKRGKLDRSTATCCARHAVAHATNGGACSAASRLAQDPALASLRSSPTFQALVSPLWDDEASEMLMKMGLPH